MKHTCSACGHDGMKVIKTYPCEDHTLRHLKCLKCKTNVFTHEYVMAEDEYGWKRINGKARLILKDE
jgi:transcriptional regulator NrdR family protein